MNKKTLSIIIIVAGLLILSVIIYVFFVGDFLNKKTESPTIDNSQVPKTINSEDGGTAGQKPIKEITFDAGMQKPAETAGNKSDSGKSDLSRIAISFAERFGTYSNQSNFSNITGLKLFMSKGMKEWSDQYISGQKKNNYDTTIYYGITTKAAMAEFQEYDDDMGVANVLVITRRREATGTTNNLANAFTQNVRIDFIKEDGSWKVDKAVWLE